MTSRNWNEHFRTNTKTITAVKRKSEASNRVKTKVRKAVRDFERLIAKEAKANPKAFYKYARSKMKTRSPVANLNLSVLMGQ